MDQTVEATSTLEAIRNLIVAAEKAGLDRADCNRNVISAARDAIVAYEIAIASANGGE